MGLRRAGRELALKALYRMDIVGDRSLREAQELIAQVPADQRARLFAMELVGGVLAEMDYLDQLLTQVVTNWSLTRLSRIDHNILRLAGFELLRRADIPARATMDEAVELAKRYGDHGSSQFVNGVIDVMAERMGVKHKGDDNLAALKD
ncbi:MAG TPA: transcription antitermination factor NusB [Candidatus Binataceae bacterium]|nr:transcription antitermination factor NusB [Candidatus Binataceae bacterium]